jgi:DNA helicase TIP49 (TBP-interacting protein)
LLKIGNKKKRLKRGKYDGDTQVSEKKTIKTGDVIKVQTQSGVVLKKRTGLVSANEQQYSLGVVLRQETGQVSKKLS